MRAAVVLAVVLAGCQHYYDTVDPPLQPSGVHHSIIGIHTPRSCTSYWNPGFCWELRQLNGGVTALWIEHYSPELAVYDAAGGAILMSVTRRPSRNPRRPKRYASAARLPISSICRGLASGLTITAHDRTGVTSHVVPRAAFIAYRDTLNAYIPAIDTCGQSSRTESVADPYAHLDAPPDECRRVGRAPVAITGSWYDTRAKELLKRCS